MKAFLYIILGLFSYSCATLTPLNKKVDAAQKIAINQSPFKSASGALGEVDQQKKIRQPYLSKLDDLRKKYPEKPIVLTEFFNVECEKCPADYVDVQTPKEIHQFHYNNGIYEPGAETFSDTRKPKVYERFSFQVKEIYRLLERKEQWNSNPAYFGNEKCKGGAHCFYTIYFPDGRVESLYIRCWTLKPGGVGHW